MKASFYLLGEKGIEVLSRFIKEFSAAQIGFVCIGKDPNVLHDFSDEILSICKKNHIEAFTRRNINKAVIENETDSIIFAVGWRWLIKETNGLVILHDSLLPKYRGFSPLVNMLINGEQNLGVTALLASSEYDRGAIVCQKAMSINYPIKIQSAIEYISHLYADIVIEIYQKKLNQKTLEAINQNNSEATYSLWRDRRDYLIDWSNDANRIKRFIDAVGYPYDGALTYAGKEAIRIYDVLVVDDVCIESRSCHLGKTIFRIDDKPVIVCGEGLLKIEDAVFCKSQQSIQNTLPFRSRFTPQPEIV